MHNMLYPTKNVCHFMCEPLWASPYLVGLVWYALSCFRMCLYQAFFAMQKKLQEKTKTQADNSSFQYFFKKIVFSENICCVWAWYQYHHTNTSLLTKLLSIAYKFSYVSNKNKAKL